MADIYDNYNVHRRAAENQEAVRKFYEQLGTPISAPLASFPPAQTRLPNTSPTPPALALLTGIVQKKTWGLFPPPQTFGYQRIFSHYIVPSLSGPLEADLVKVKALSKKPDVNQKSVGKIMDLLDLINSLNQEIEYITARRSALLAI